MITHSSRLQTFRKKLYALFTKRKDAIMNLLDALTGYGHVCKSVVQLSNMGTFERQYSSITDAIADGLTEVKWDKIRQLIYQEISACSQTKPHRFIIDCTPNPRPFASTLADRHITHQPNAAPGNKPICVGHQYSLLTLLPNDKAAQEKHWVGPLSARRVQSAEKGNEVGMQQIIDSINELGLTDQLSISIGDSLYGTEICRKTASQQDNLIHIFRMNSKRNVFSSVTEQERDANKKGRKKEYGAKMTLNDSNTHRAHDRETTYSWVSAKGKAYIAHIKCWNNMLLRGSRAYRSSQYPLHIIQVAVTDAEGKAVFKRPLWLGVFGKKRDEIELIDIFKCYKSRYDIEHFIRFSKRNLLMDAYQTADVHHEELWWQLCLVAYAQLYLGKETVPKIPQPWERYLPAYKNTDNNKQAMSTPSQTQRGFSNLLNTIGTPAKPCVARGKARGRIAGETQIKREAQDIVFKAKKPTKSQADSILLGSEPEGVSSNPQKIDDLIRFVQSSLEKHHVSVAEFTNMLINSN